MKQDQAKASKVAATSNSSPARQAPKSLPTREGRLYTPCSSPTNHPESLLIPATVSDIAARVLRDANCTLPLAVTPKANDRGSVTLLVSHHTTPAAAFTPSIDAFRTQLNCSFPVSDSPWVPFHPAPNEIQMVIHSLPLSFLPANPEELFTSLALSILYPKKLQILSARYEGDHNAQQLDRVNPERTGWQRMESE